MFFQNNFSTLTLINVRQSFCPVTLFGDFLAIFNGFENVSNFAFFKKISYLIVALFANFEAKHTLNSFKKEEPLLLDLSLKSILYPFPVWKASFCQKKVKILASCYSFRFCPFPFLQNYVSLPAVAVICPTF